MAANDVSEENDYVSEQSSEKKSDSSEKTPFKSNQPRTIVRGSKGTETIYIYL